MSRPIITVSLRYEEDVVVARQRSRQVAARLGFEAQDSARIATAVSEIARWDPLESTCRHASLSIL